jgi:LacI family transcriptional regulator
MAKLASSMPHVAILLESTYATHTQILRGILRFTQLHTPWTLDVRMGRAGEPTTFDAKKWNVDGVIANRLPPNLSALIRRHRTPTIVMNDIGGDVQPIARILCDNASIARLAADTLANAGFQNFAFVGERSGIQWSVEREQAFADEIARRGFPCNVYQPDRNDVSDDSRHLQKWLLGLPRPTAIFAAYDIRAREVLDACHAAGLAVPDDIAILGVDDDEVICETATPTLSSIPLSMEDAGFRAAELLDRVLTTHRRPRDATDIIFTGTRVVTRRSTLRDAVADALVRRCRALMEANIDRAFNVSDLVASLGVSRRTLETRFRAATGHSLNDEITHLRIRRAKTLLAKSSMSQAAIAAACGFCDASHLNVIFRRHCGAPPSAFRENK